LLVSFVDEVEFSEMVGVAQTMGSVIVLEVRFPGVVDGCAVELRQDANVIHRCRAAFLVKLVVRQRGCTGAVYPVQFAHHTETCLVKMHHM
jgi:hypothetical protein